MKYLALLCLLASSAYAQQTTYTYSGAPMSGTLTGQDNGEDYTILGGTVVLASPLAPNQANQNVVPVSFNFQGDNLLMSPSTYVQTANFQFTTVNGQITSWLITVDTNSGSGTIESLSITTNGDGYINSGQFGGCFEPTQQCWYFTASNNARGIWSVGGVVQSAAAPAVACAAPVSSPARAVATAAPAPVTTQPILSVPVHFRPIRELR